MNEQEQLDWLARNVSEWPTKSTPDVTIGWQGISHGVIPDYIIKGNDGTGYEITYNEWQAHRSELINKPSWDDAPECAKYLAQDGDGQWCFFRGNPVLTDLEWGCGAEPGFKCSKKGEPLNWKNSLEKRPEKYTMKGEAFKPTHTVSELFTVKKTDCVIKHKSDSFIIGFDGEREFVYELSDVEVLDYKSPKQKQFDAMLEKWKRQSLDCAHDNRDSTATIGYVLGWVLDNYEIEEK